MKRSEFLKKSALTAVAVPLAAGAVASSADDGVRLVGRAPHGAADLWAAVKGREKEFPILARSLMNARPAFTCKVEWIVRNGQDVSINHNWTQIVRHPFEPGRRSADEVLTWHLNAIEDVLSYGKREFITGSRPIGFCGGWHDVLGRGTLRPSDKLSLRVLGDLRHLKNRQDNLSPVRVDEWLTEFSLQAVAA